MICLSGENMTGSDDKKTLLLVDDAPGNIEVAREILKGFYKTCSSPKLGPVQVAEFVMEFYTAEAESLQTSGKRSIMTISPAGVPHKSEQACGSCRRPSISAEG